jgi:uncharacterized protein (TIGR02688 family)
MKDFEEKRRAFSRDEWLDLLINTVGLNPNFYSLRQKLLILTRLIPIAERMVHLMELGQRETGKSYGHKNLSYYSYMLSGGRATPAVLFVHGGNGTPGLVVRFDTLVFDEIANTEFKDPVATVARLSQAIRRPATNACSIRATPSLEQAAAFIIELGWSFDKYCERFRDARPELRLLHCRRCERRT